MKKTHLAWFGPFPVRRFVARPQSVDRPPPVTPIFASAAPADSTRTAISGSVAYNPNRWLGVVADVGGYHASPGGVSLNTYTYLFGPAAFSLHNPSHLTPFVSGPCRRLAHHYWQRRRFPIASSPIAFGGGVDFGILPHLAFRPQVDYVGLDTPGRPHQLHPASPPASSSTSDVFRLFWFV